MMTAVQLGCYKVLLWWFLNFGTVFCHFIKVVKKMDLDGTWIQRILLMFSPAMLFFFYH